MYVTEYHTRLESAQREASRDPIQEHATIASTADNSDVDHQLSNGENCSVMLIIALINVACDAHIIDQYSI